MMIMLKSWHVMLPLMVWLTIKVSVTDGGAASVDVGVVLNTNTPFGKNGLASLRMGLEEFYATQSHSQYTTRLVLHVNDSKETTVGAASAGLYLMESVGVEAVIGPESSGQAVFLSELATKAQVPLISFTVTSTSLSSRDNPFFVRTTPNDSAQVPAIAALVQSFSWREVVLIYEDSEFGSGIVPSLTDSLQDVGALVTHRSLVRSPPDGSQIAGELLSLRGKRTRVFIVHMTSDLGLVLFSKAKELGMMGSGYVWIMTTGITMELDSIDTSVLSGGGGSMMEGVLGVRPCVDVGAKVLDEFTQRWKNRTRDKIGPGLFDLWAYDTVWALAEAAEKVNVDAASELRSIWRPDGGNGLGIPDLMNLSVSQAGPRLLDSMSRTDFVGISGRFRLVDRQLEAVGFELINVIEGGEARVIGNWTLPTGISRYNSDIVWPGKLRNTPRGWEWPTTGNKLRIGVPKEGAFPGFVNITFDVKKNRTAGSGICIEVFEAAMKHLDYEVPYEYIPYVDAHGNANGTYDDLIYQVYLNNFDAVVGDTSIWFNRSNYVDFTTPYTESGVVMIVVIQQAPWHLGGFLDPMTYQLWLASLAAFVLTGLTIWLLEHRINEAFMGTSLHKFGRVFYFSFSTMVFMHKEKLLSNLSRVVVIVWVFVVLVLTSSYTASLSSMLTSRQLQPVVTDRKGLISKGEKVGYLKDSFVKSLLLNLGFHESNLVAFDGPDEYAEALSKGSSLDGGVAAIFDEIPYIRIFLSKYPEYTVAGSTYKTDGFGFIFPKGSPLVPDISRAILQVREQKKMIEFEKQLYGDMANAPLSSMNDQGTTSRLSFTKLMGLFLVTGITSTAALLLHLAIFYLQNSKTPRGADDSGCQ